MIHNLYLAGLLEKNHKYHFTSFAREIILNKYLIRKEHANSQKFLACLLVEQLSNCTNPQIFEKKFKALTHTIDKIRAIVLNDINDIKRIQREEKTGLSLSQEQKAASMLKLLNLLKSKNLVSS